MQELLLATHNPAKVREYRLLLDSLPYRLVMLADLGLALQVPEEGATFEENARVKATTYAAHSGRLTLAEDSGLEVEALGGEPGVRSARYAGEGATNAERIRLLLSRMEGLPWERRRARFCCVIALAWPQGGVEVCRGECWGYITLEPQGSQGFGYDPVFYLPELGRTMAQLPLEVKNQVSHRGQAAHRARSLLEKRVGEEVRL